jgi:hypothetical protein
VWNKSISPHVKKVIFDVMVKTRLMHGRGDLVVQQKGSGKNGSSPE